MAPTVAPADTCGKGDGTNTARTTPCGAGFDRVRGPRADLGRALRKKTPMRMTFYQIRQAAPGRVASAAFVDRADDLDLDRPGPAARARHRVLEFLHHAGGAHAHLAADRERPLRHPVLQEDLRHAALRPLRRLATKATVDAQVLLGLPDRARPISSRRPRRRPRCKRACSSRSAATTAGHGADGARGLLESDNFKARTDILVIRRADSIPTALPTLR